jgi:site-specific recombinase XerD
MGTENGKKVGSIITYTKGRLYRVKLRGKIQSKGKISLYLDYYRTYTRTEEGKVKPKKEFEYLGIYILEKPKTTKERQYNKEKQELALKIREKRESDLNHNSEGLISPNIKRINFLDYFQKFLDNYPNKDIRIVRYCFEHFKTFLGKDYLAPSDVTEDLLIKFKGYLDKNLNGETPYNYFTKLKKLTKQAYEERVLSKNPAENIKNTRNEGLKKEILNFTEIQALAKAKCGNPEVKRAFLFCLNTGLRFCDVKELKWQNINEDRIIIKSQQKTNKPVYIDLNNTAIKLLGKQGEYDKNVFTLPSLSSALRTIKTWTGETGINRNITWHSTRHSFAVNLLINKTDIKTVSGLLGHAGLKHTEKYTRIVDELKKQAVNTLPEIDL